MQEMEKRIRDRNEQYVEHMEERVGEGKDRDNYEQYEECVRET